MKRIQALVVSLFLILSLSSALAEEKVTIEFFCVKEEVQSIFQEIINDFEAENPDIHVELTYASDGETVLLTRIASNESSGHHEPVSGGDDLSSAAGRRLHHGSDRLRF